MTRPDQPDLLARLRVLAVLELEVDQFIAEQVAAARVGQVSWDAIAEAVGVARPTAWRRWNPGIEDPRPTRPQRRDAGRLELTGDSLRAVRWVADRLVERVEGHQDAHPWSTATRAALNKLSLKYEATSVEARETEYRVREHRAVITCVEPGINSPGVCTWCCAPTATRCCPGRHPRRPGSPPPTCPAPVGVPPQPTCSHSSADTCLRAPPEHDGEAVNGEPD